MKAYVDSGNYAMMAEALTSKLADANSRSEEFFREVQYKLTDLARLLNDEYALRREFLTRIEDEEWNTPEELPDFDTAPQAVIDENYDAWDEYMGQYTTFEADTEFLDELISTIERAM